MQNLEADDKAQGISHANTNSSHPNQFKRFVSGELTVQHSDRSLLFLFLSTAVLPWKNLASHSTNVVSAVS